MAGYQCDSDVCRWVIELHPTDPTWRSYRNMVRAVLTECYGLRVHDNIETLCRPLPRHDLSDMASICNALKEAGFTRPVLFCGIRASEAFALPIRTISSVEVLLQLWDPQSGKVIFSDDHTEVKDSPGWAMQFHKMSGDLNDAGKAALEKALTTVLVKSPLAVTRSTRQNDNPAIAGDFAF